MELRTTTMTLILGAAVVSACAGKKPSPQSASGDAAGTAHSASSGGEHRPILEPGTPGWDDDALTNAAYALVPRRQLEIANVSTAFRWHPGDGQELLVWAVCQGSGDTRGCTVLAGRRWDEHQLRVLAYQPCGWSQPTISETPDPAQLLVSGDDGRGTWAQVLQYDSGDTSLHFSRRTYPDGL